MNSKRSFYLVAALAIIVVAIAIFGFRLLTSSAAPLPPSLTHPHTPSIPTADDPSAPAETVKLIFIHHSTGGNWLADPNGEQYNGGLGRALMENNYFVSATNYGWGPDEIGSNTDIGYWWDWFRGDDSATYTTALYNENGQNICNPTADPPYECFGVWPRMPITPTGENEIVIFKSCFPNAHMDDTPTIGDNLLRGQSAWIWDDDQDKEIPNPNHTISNAMGIYNDILQYFGNHQEKLFIVIAGPPLLADDMYFPTDTAHAANYRTFNEWLVNDWLDTYPHSNVAVFDFYNVLTSNNGDPDTNDVGLETGNHHRWWNDAVQHVHPIDNNLSSYGVSQDSHPNTAGHQKATAEFVPLLNVYYNRWKSGGTTCTAITDVGISGATSGVTDTLYSFTGVITPTNATEAITYTWSPAPFIGQGTATSSYQWATPGWYTLTLTAENCNVSVPGTHNISISAQPTACPNPLVSVSISGATSGYTETLYTFSAVTAPSGASTPITYTWTPAPDSGQSSASASYTWATTGAKTITVTAENCGGSDAATHDVNIRAKQGTYYINLPLVTRNYSAAASTCSSPLTGVTISGSASGATGTTYTFNAAPTPTNATTPIAYTWTPAPQSGQNTASASYQWDTTGSKTVKVAASNCSGAHTADNDHTITIQAASSGDLVQPGDFTYLGAFRLPGGGDPPLTFAYGGNAMTFDPSGDSGNGSLFIMGHDRQPWGGLPNGGQIAEISIPTPVSSTNLVDLNTAAFIQNFSNVAEGYFTDLEELPRTGMAYLDNPATGPKIHLSWAQHHEPDTPIPTYAWFDPDLSTPNLQGLWFIGEQNYYSLNGYMFEIPSAWADAHVEGRYLATGRAMDGGWGGMGPSLFAYRPWQIDGSPEISGTHLLETTLLLYQDTQDNGDIVVGANTVDGHQHPDEWEGGEWLTTAAGKSAVLFIGNKGIGAKYWYGYRNPAGPEYPCVNTQAASEFTACRMADGTACPAADMIQCEDHTSAKGWWCAQFDARLVLYDPADLAKVAAGTMESWEPQPYNHLSIGDHLFDNPAGVDLGMLGQGIQRRYLFGDVTFDRDNGLLYVIENFADDAKPVIHVWSVQ